MPPAVSVTGMVNTSNMGWVAETGRVLYMFENIWCTLGRSI